MCCVYRATNRAYVRDHFISYASVFPFECSSTGEKSCTGYLAWTWFHAANMIVPRSLRALSIWLAPCLFNTPYMWDNDNKSLTLAQCNRFLERRRKNLDSQLTYRITIAYELVMSAWSTTLLQYTLIDWVTSLSGRVNLWIRRTW